MRAMPIDICGRVPVLLQVWSGLDHAHMKRDFQIGTPWPEIQRGLSVMINPQRSTERLLVVSERATLLPSLIFCLR